MTDDRFHNCIQRRFRFVGEAKPLRNGRQVSLPADVSDSQASASSAGATFHFRPPLGVQVQELDSGANSEQSDVTVKVLAMDSPVPEAALHSAEAWLFEGPKSKDMNSEETIRTMQMQGCTILQHGTRMVIFTLTEDRIVPILKTMLEAFYLEREVGRLESELAKNWSDWDEDIPLGIVFGERQLGTRARLVEHHNAVRRFRSRLERLSPAIHAPHVYPPTYASQASERYRERAQLSHRHEVLDGQLQSFETLYESCAQRASDYANARTGHILEWVIIFLLVIQVLFYSFEILTSTEESATTPPTNVSQSAE
jgi:hypothetical protein